MPRLTSLPRPLLVAIPLLVATVFVLLFLTSQSGPPQLVSVFGIDPAELEADFGVIVHPPDGAPALSGDDAMAAARRNHRDAKIAGVELVRIKLVYEWFDDLAWAVKWDVDGEEAVQPVGLQEAEHEPPWLYVFDVMFIDAKTGGFLTGAELTSPASDFEKAQDHVITQ